MLTLSPVPFLASLNAAQAQTTQATISISVFFDTLAPHGVWVKHPQYRYVFCPKVEADWRPYTNGRWLYIRDYGWYFASDEPFAWAVYHYGRWFDDERLGWCWVPGNAWAGAWVSWRHSEDHIGWAPLGPTREGFVIDVDVEASEPPPERWIFVPAERFLEPNLEVTIVFGNQQPDVFQSTTYAGPVVVENNIVVNNVIDIDFIQQVTNQQVIIVEPTIVEQPDQVNVDVDANVVTIFSPQIEPPTQEEAPEQAVEIDQAVQDLGGGDPSAPSSEPSAAPSDGASSAEVSASSAPPDASSAPSSAVSSEASSMSSVAPSSEAPVSSAPASEEPTSSAPASEVSSVPSEAPSSSVEAPSSATSVESSEPDASAPSSQLCPEGFEWINGECVPIESSSAQ
jgi:hypothetical protein